MADGTSAGGFTGDDAGPRRSTFTPPPVEADIPATLGESQSAPESGAPAASESGAGVGSSLPTPPAPTVSESWPPPPPPPAPAPEPAFAAAAVPSPELSLPPAPVRQSLSDQEIVARMGGAAGDTSSLIAALQEQMDLRAKEDEEFESWEALVRQSVDEEAAERAIRAGRRAFDKLPPEAAQEAPVAVPEEVSAEPTVAVAGVQEPVSEPIILPRFGEAPAPVGEGPSATEGATAAFEKILSDDVDSPKTDAWPLVDVDDTESAAQLVTVVAQEELVVADSEGEFTARESFSVSQLVQDRPVAESVFEDAALSPAKRFGFDQVGPEPSPTNTRIDRGLQLLWAWWAVGAPLPVVLVGAWLVSGGLNFAQAALAAGVGIVIAALPIVAGSVLGNRTGLPTLVSSRAAYGLSGNVIPAVLMALIRVLVAAAALYAATWTIVGILVESNYWNTDETVIGLVIGAIVSLLAFGLAIPGRGWVSLTLWISAGLATLGLVALVVFTVDPITRQATSGALGTAAELTAGISVVLSVFLVVWAHFGGDLARFSRPGTGGSSSALSTVGAVLPPLVLVAWGALLAASGPEIAQSLLSDPFDAILGTAPGWYPVPAILVFALPVVGIAALALHSSGYALQSLGVSLPRYGAVSIVGVIATAVALVLLGLNPDIEADTVSFALALAVPVAAWVGGYTGDLLTRRVRLDPRALTGSIGNYPRWRVAPVLGFMFSVGLGWGCVSAEPFVLSWMGYLERLLSDYTVVDITGWQIGPLIALGLALVVSLFAGIRGGVLSGSERNPTS